MSESGFPHSSPFPPPPGKNYRKNDCIVYYPDLIEPLFPVVISIPRTHPLNGKWAIREFGIAVGNFLKRTKQNRKEQRDFYEIYRTGNGSVCQGR